jgi:hypothetical protein
MAGPEFSSEVDGHAAELFALMSSPFERDFEALGYKARLHLHVSPDARIFQDEPTDVSGGRLSDSKLDSTQAWVAEVGYLPAKEGLGFTRLELPLKTPGRDEILILQRVMGHYFLPIHSKDGVEQEFNSPHSPDGKAVVLPAIFVNSLLARAGYTLPELFTSPDDLRLHMAELTGVATKWAAQETIVIPEDPTSQTTITRIFSQRSNGSREEVDLTLSSISETISPDNMRRQQITIAFNGSDYSVEPPDIYVQELRQTDAILAQPGTETYEIVKRTGLEATPELLDKLAEGMVDVLSNA